MDLAEWLDGRLPFRMSVSAAWTVWPDNVRLLWHRSFMGELTLVYLLLILQKPFNLEIEGKDQDRAADVSAVARILVIFDSDPT